MRFSFLYSPSPATVLYEKNNKGISWLRIISTVTFIRPNLTMRENNHSKQSSFVRWIIFLPRILNDGKNISIWQMRKVGFRPQLPRAGTQTLFFKPIYSFNNTSLGRSAGFWEYKDGRPVMVPASWSIWSSEKDRKQNLPKKSKEVPETKETRGSPRRLWASG